MNLNVGFTENAESFAAGLNKNKKDFNAKYSDVKLIHGKDGKDGFSPIVTVESIFGGHRVTITDASGTQVFDVMNGEDGSPGATGPAGADGAPGKDGADGKDGKDGFSPQKGIDYFTDADKAEMIQAVINALPVYNGEVVSA